MGAFPPGPLLMPLLAVRLPLLGASQTVRSLWPVPLRLVWPVFGAHPVPPPPALSLPFSKEKVHVLPPSVFRRRCVSWTVAPLWTHCSCTARDAAFDPCSVGRPP
eukprot:EG_transcript_15317